MGSNKKFTIVVNSSDGFEDCWIPFFTLFKKYWPDCNAQIILNTEKKKFYFPGLDIVSSNVNFDFDKKFTWSECLIMSLNKVDTPLVLYLQEDYFLEKPVNSKLIEEFTNIMLTNSEVKYIGLTRFGNNPPFRSWEINTQFYEVSKKSKYIASTQAALWDKQTLLSLLRSDENGWMFEIYGTGRVRKRKDLFLTINREIFNEMNPIIYYQPTGIVKGKWIVTMPELFKKEGLKMDFSLRGFYKEKNTLLRKIETIKMLLRNPKKLIPGLLNR